MTISSKNESLARQVEHMMTIQSPDLVGMDGPLSQWQKQWVAICQARPHLCDTYLEATSGRFRKDNLHVIKETMGRKDNLINHAGMTALLKYTQEWKYPQKNVDEMVALSVQRVIHAVLGQNPNEQTAAQAMLETLVNQYDLLDRKTLGSSGRRSYGWEVVKRLMEDVDLFAPDDGREMDPEVAVRIREAGRQLFRVFARAGTLDNRLGGEESDKQDTIWSLACRKNKNRNGYGAPVLLALLDEGVEWEATFQQIDTTSRAVVETHPRWKQARLMAHARTGIDTEDSPTPSWAPKRKI